MEILLSTLLATYGVSHLLVYDYGPWDILSKFRYFMGVRESPEGRYSDKMIGSILNCLVCTSVWIAFPIAYLCTLNAILAYGLAAIGFVCLVNDLGG
jgi:hypothetical protein